MKIKYLVVLGSLAGLLPMQGALVTSTTCSVGSQTVSSAVACAINPSNSAPSSAAGITATQVAAIPTSGLSGLFSFNIGGSATAIPLVSSVPIYPTTTNSSALAQANLTQSFTTGGLARAGLITFSANVLDFSSGPGTDAAVADLSIGALTGHCQGNSSCTGILSQVAPRSFTFALGGPFMLSLAETFSASGGYVDGPGFASGTTGFDFQLFEADGTTPVTLVATPEPGQAGLFVAGAMALGAWAGWRGQRGHALFRTETSVCN